MDESKDRDILLKEIAILNEKIDLINIKLENIKNSTKFDLDHELFFGMVLSLGLLLLNYPDASVMEAFFTFSLPHLSNPGNYANYVRLILTVVLIISAIYRYLGAINNDSSKTRISITLFLMSMLFVIHIYCFSLMNTMFVNYNPLKLLPPSILWVINIYIFMPLEIKLIKKYSQKFSIILGTFVFILISQVFIIYKLIEYGMYYFFRIQLHHLTLTILASILNIPLIYAIIIKVQRKHS